MASIACLLCLSCLVATPLVSEAAKPQQALRGEMAQLDAMHTGPLCPALTVNGRSLPEIDCTSEWGWLKTTFHVAGGEEMKQAYSPEEATRIVFKKKPFGDDGAANLAVLLPYMPGLYDLNLQNRNLSDEDLYKLGVKLRLMPGLKSLDIRNNKQISWAMKAVMKSFECKGCEWLVN